MLEGLLLKDRATFMVSARRTYFDILAQPFIALQNKSRGGDGKLRAGYYFYDLNAKLNYRFSDKSRLFLSSYSGKDRMYARQEFTDNNQGQSYHEKSKYGLEWGNTTTALRYNQIIGPKLFSNTTLTYSRYRFIVESESNSSNSREGNKISQRYNEEYLSGIFD